MTNKITYWRLKNGNYRGRFGKYFIFIRARNHYNHQGFDKFYKWWTAIISLNGEALFGEGIFGSSLSTIKKAKDWVKQTIHINLNS